MIPKFIHHIWIGTKPFPSDYINLKKWRLLYPDYNIYLIVL
jgi:mannosyltransferase OCH1-like enzyme